MRTVAISFTLALTVSACESVQTTSGAEYLARYDAAMATTAVAAKEAAIAPDDVNQMVREAAAVEPILILPARLGIARLERGALTDIPSEETALWAGLAERHRLLGQFVAINPLNARLSADATGHRPGICTLPGHAYTRRVEEVVDGIRIGAARQHVDAVLIYEVAAASNKDSTLLGFMDITIVGGAILPTRAIKAEGHANALLLDVRNGYPYGTANAAVSLDALSPSWGSDRRRDTLRAEATKKAVAQLVPDVDAMLTALAQRLAPKARSSVEG